MPELTREELLAKINMIAETNGFGVSENAEKIANAKLRMFNEEWWRCPCDGSNQERFCCSQLCQSDIRNQGQCHCGLFKVENNARKDYK